VQYHIHHSSIKWKTTYIRSVFVVFVMVEDTMEAVKDEAVTVEATVGGMMIVAI
jgi:hypothetical protein